MPRKSMYAKGMTTGDIESHMKDLYDIDISDMNGLKNRGVEDILIACIDGLTGFPQAIDAVYPQTENSTVYYPSDTQFH